MFSLSRPGRLSIGGSAYVPLMITAGSSTFDLMRFTPITVARLSTLILLTAQFSWISCKNLWAARKPRLRQQEVARREQSLNPTVHLLNPSSFPCFRNGVNWLCLQEFNWNLELHRLRRGEEPGEVWAGGGKSHSRGCLGRRGD